MRGRSRTGWWGVVLEAPDARALAQFYAQVLGWSIAGDEPGWATIAPPDTDESGLVGSYLAFNTSAEYVRPVWPSAGEQQQMMMHVDVAVDDLDAAVAGAVELGATQAEYQPQDDVRVMLDPAGHPFCLYLDK